MKKSNSLWLGLLLVGTIISVPEGTLTRIASDALSFSMITALRYSVAAVFALPFVLLAIRRHRVTVRRLAIMALPAIPLSLDPLISQYVIVTTNASFQAILSLFTPIVFVILSTMITRDRVSRRKLIGFLLAVLGGMTMVLLPSIISSPGTNFGSLPVILMFVQAICISIEIIVWRRENERGAPLIVILGVYYFVWAIIATATVALLGETIWPQHLSTQNLAIIIYLGVVTSIVYNAVFTGFYRRVGTSDAATMKYLKKALAIVLPIIVLGETLSWQISLGTLLIVAGTIVVHENHKPRSKHSSALRRHTRRVRRHS